MKQELREPHFICGNIDQGNVSSLSTSSMRLSNYNAIYVFAYCLFQGSGKVIVSMDAIFGLPRKKAAGESVRQPLHGHLFFDEQSQVDKYVSNATKVRSSTSKVTTRVTILS